MSRILLLVTTLLFALPGWAGTAAGVRALEAGDYEEAYKALRPAAENGDAQAQYYLAKMYGQDVAGFTKDYEAANSWLRRAATQGHTKAILGLGYVHSNGIGVAVDKNKAASLYRRAAEAGDPIAQRNLALMYRSGEGVARDKNSAMRWFRKAAEQGDAIAQRHLGLLLQEPVRRVRHPQEAAQWLRQAATQGDPGAQVALAEMYRKGDGVEQDSDKAVMWHRRSAIRGDVRDKAIFGMFLHFDGIHREEEAYAWLRPAAIQGMPLAQYYLGIHIANGTGVERNWPLGYAWFVVAKSSGNPRVAGLDVSEARAAMSEQELERAHAYVRAIRKDPAAMAPLPKPSPDAKDAD